MTQPFELNLMYRGERNLSLMLHSPCLDIDLLPMDPCTLNKNKLTVLHISLFILTFPLCINHVFYFLYSDALLFGVLMTLKGLPPPRVSQFLEIVNSLPSSVLVKRKETDPEPTPQSPPSLGLSHSGPLSTCPIHLGPGITQPETPFVPSLMKLFKLACLPCFTHSFP